MKKIAMLVVTVMLLTMLPSGIANATSSTYSPTITSSPVASWYNTTPYSYVVHTSQQSYFHLKTNSSLSLMYADTVNSSYATVFGTITTTKQVNSYWVNVSLVNVTDAKTFSWQNYTLTVYNKPYIYSQPTTVYFGTTYQYNFTANQGGTFSLLAPGFSLNATKKIVSSSSLTGQTYTLSLTLSNSNGTYTQMWSISPYATNVWSFTAHFGNASVNMTVPSGFVIGITNQTLLIDGAEYAQFQNTTGGYYTFSFVYSSGSPVYTVTSSSSSNAPVALIWHAVPDAEYSIAMYDNGHFVNRTNVLSDSNGVVTFSYNPATMPLDPTFALVPPPNQPDPNVTSLLTIMAIAIGLGLLVWALMGRRR